MNNSRKVYVEILNDRIGMLNKQIMALDTKIKNTKFTLAKDEKKLIALQKEVEKIEQEKKEYEVTNAYDYKNNLSMEVLDTYYDSKETKKQKIEEQIQDLNNIKAQLKTERAKKRVDRQIARRQEKIKKLQKKETRISGVQRTIIMSKRIVLNRKNRAFSKQEAKVDFYDNKLQDTQTIRNTLDPTASGLKGIKDSVLDGIYSLKEKHYMKKKAKHDEILNTMKQRDVGIKGASAIVMKKKAVDKLRNVKQQLNEMLDDQNNENTQVNNINNTISI